MKTNSDKRNTSKRRHINEFMKSRLANSGRAAGMGMLYDDYSESAYPSGTMKTNYFPEKKVGIPLTEEEKKFRDEGGPVKTYHIKEDKP